MRTKSQAPLAVIEKLGAVARTREIAAAGGRRGDLADAMADGLLLRPRFGIYAVVSTPLSVIHALSHRGVIGCVTAGRDLGLWILDEADADSTLAPQVRIPGVGVVDFVIGDCLILEADGNTHDGPQRHADRVRDAVAAALGFSTLRFDYALIVHDWPLVEGPS